VVACTSCGKRNRVPLTAKGTPSCAVCGTGLPWVVDAGEQDFDQATSATVPVIVDLWAPWCGPCRTLSPAIEALAAERAGRLKVVKVNVDEAPGISQRFQVQGIPTLLLVLDGGVRSRQVGALPAAALRRWLDDHTSGLGGS
jgi:thioredoxin 2